MFLDVQSYDMTDPRILDTDAYEHMLCEFNKEIDKGPTYVCNICWKFEYKTNILIFHAEKYDPDLLQKCKPTGKNTGYICKGCDRYLKRTMMPPQAQTNGLHLNEVFPEINDLCPLELSLVSQIIPFMFIVPRHRGAQHGLKGLVVLVPSDLTKIQKVLPRSCDEGHIISLALKRRLSDKSAYHKQMIRPASVNAALTKLIENHVLYRNITDTTQTWEQISKDYDPEFWDMLTNNHIEIYDVNLKANSGDESDSDTDDIEIYEKSQVPLPTVVHQTDGPNITTNQILNIAPGEGQRPVSNFTEPNWEALDFVKQYSQGEFHYNSPRDKKLPLQNTYMLDLNAAIRDLHQIRNISFNV